MNIQDMDSRCCLKAYCFKILKPCLFISVWSQTWTPLYINGMNSIIRYEYLMQHGWQQEGETL